MINKRATMLASPHRFSKKWNENLQNDFDQILHYFDEASTEERERFENDNNQSSTPEREPWLRIIKA